MRGSHEARHPHSTKLGVPTALTDSSIQSTPDNPSHPVLSPCTISECSLLDTSNAHPSPRAPTVLTSPSTQLAPKPYTKPIIRRVRRKHGRLRSNRCIESAPGRLSNTLEITQSARFRYSTKIYHQESAADTVRKHYAVRHGRSPSRPWRPRLTWRPRQCPASDTCLLGTESFTDPRGPCLIR